MNKDVIYIEPEDDITDIISKIEGSKEKIVALVPPKKAGVFRSVVNIKLIAKSGASSKKTVVLVTTDPSIIKLAAATKIPVTKDLQTAPSVPTLDKAEEEVTKEELVSAENEEDEKNDSSEKSEEGEIEDNDKDDEEEDDKNKKKESSKKEKKNRPKFLTWIIDHKKMSIVASIAGAALIVFLVWAITIAPAVTVTVGIKTTSNNFSENITFTTDLEKENIEEGKFFLAKKEIKKTAEVEFEATGTKNVGEKAKGNVVVYAYFKQKGSVAIDAGSSFTINDLSYVSSKEGTLVWEGNDVCENSSQASIALSGCLISGRIDVVATAPGTKYNIAASSTGWNTAANVGVYSDQAMAGGTDDTVTVVQQSDIDKAKDGVANSNEEENREELYETLSDETMPINSSFSQTITESLSTPALGEEVKEGEKPTLKVTTTISVFVIDKTKVKEFISEKAKLGESQKIYEINSPFIENFVETTDGYTGKLKTSFVAGPRITENDVIEIIKGKGLGEANHDLKEIDGVNAVRIDASYPWVTSVPNNVNKIDVILDVKE